MTTVVKCCTARTTWCWMVPVLLLASALTIPQLGFDAFHHDEAFSMIAAGIHRSGPWSLSAVWDAIAHKSPEQALGWPMLLSIWVQFVGWSEVSGRTIPFLAGILALALVYRTGCKLFNRSTGLLACLFLAGSAFFLAYFSIARAFSLVALFSMLVVLCYWQGARHNWKGRRGDLTGFFLGSAGLLYSHYFGALILPALFLFHLLFGPKNRRWWIPVILLGAALLLASLQLPVFLQGLDRSVSNEALHERAMSPSTIVDRFIRFHSNDLLNPSDQVVVLLVFPCLLLLLFLSVRSLRGAIHPGPLQYLLFVSVTLLGLILATNEIIQVLVSNRIRYLIPLWPLTALLIAAGLQRLARRNRLLVAGILLVWVTTGVNTISENSFRYMVDYLRRTDIHHIFHLIQDRKEEVDFLVLDYQAELLDPGRLYTKDLDLPYKIIYRQRDEPLASVAPVHENFTYAWLLFRLEDKETIGPLANELGRFLCEIVYEGRGFTLQRYALSPAHCPQSPARLAFDENIAMTQPDPGIEDGVLRFLAGISSQDDYLLAHYSLAVHVVEPRTGERIAQGDVGVGPGAFVPVRSDLDVSALPPGDYEVHVALYDWQTGERLTARDLETGTISDMHVLHRFRIG